MWQTTAAYASRLPLARGRRIGRGQRYLKTRRIIYLFFSFWFGFETDFRTLYSLIRIVNIVCLCVCVWVKFDGLSATLQGDTRAAKVK